MITARTISVSYMRRDNRFIRNFCLQNYTPVHWWECDIFEITAAGYFREYEIKLTRGDFFADAKKNRPKNFGRQATWDSVTKIYTPHEVELKHDLLAVGDIRGPSKFWYLTPENLIKPEELPKWAGLIEFHFNSVFGFREKVKAPQIHKTKCVENVLSAARETCYYRMHNLLAGMREDSSATSAVEEAA